MKEATREGGEKTMVATVVAGQSDDVDQTLIRDPPHQSEEDTDHDRQYPRENDHGHRYSRENDLAHQFRGEIDLAHRLRDETDLHRQ